MSLTPDEIEQAIHRVLAAVGAEATWQSRSPRPVESPLPYMERQQSTDHLSPDALARLIDHTLLKPEATEAQIGLLCQEARTYRFATVCVNPFWVPLCASLLENSDVGVCSVVGFPLGATLSAVKAYEARQLFQQGAREIDMVLNIGALKSRAYPTVMDDISAVVASRPSREAKVKVIIEAALLTDTEKVEACALAAAAGADYVKTSTGFASGGATVEDVALMRRVVGDAIGVKAAGGIRTYRDAQRMVAAGASRIGASAGVQIVHECREETR